MSSTVGILYSSQAPDAFHSYLRDKTQEILSKILDLSKHTIKLIEPEDVASGRFHESNPIILAMPGGNAFQQTRIVAEFPNFTSRLKSELADKNQFGIEATCASAYLATKEVNLLLGSSSGKVVDKALSDYLQVRQYGLCDSYIAHGPLYDLGWDLSAPWESRKMITITPERGESFSSLYIGGPHFEPTETWIPELSQNGTRKVLATTNFALKEFSIVASELQVRKYEKKSRLNPIVMRSIHAECLDEFKSEKDKEGNLNLMRQIYGEELKCSLAPSLAESKDE